MTEGKREIIRGLLSEYDIQSAQDIQEALKDLLSGTIKEMMETEMEDHLGYEKSYRSENNDYRNGYKPKTVKSSIGEIELEIPQDRKSTFEPKDVRKIIYTTNAIESLNSSYRKLNRQRSVFPSDQALLKALYLATFEATKKWTQPLSNWAIAYGELCIMYAGRLPD